MTATEIQAKEVCEGNEIEGFGVAESDPEAIGTTHVRIYFAEIPCDLPATQQLTAYL